MTAAYEFYLGGVETALRQTDYLVGDDLTIADISFVCDFAQFLRERPLRGSTGRCGPCLGQSQRAGRLSTRL